METRPAILKSGYVYELPPLPEKTSSERVSGNRMEGCKTYTFAYSFEVDIHPGSYGAWHETVGYDVWNVKIRSRNALSIGLIFSEFELEEGVRLFLFNNDRSVVYGAYTSLNNKSWGRLAVSHLPGDEITLQMEVPGNFDRQYGKLRVGSVAHAYRDVFVHKTDPFDRIGWADTCNVDINCEAGADWQVTKRGVCRIIINNVQLCTGCLINNARNDSAPYVYMADHSFYEPSPVNAEDALFYFNFECPECGCDSLTDHTVNSISGSEKLAGGDSIDFALVELSAMPPDSYNVYYAGWNRSPDVPGWTASIHHPRGDVKKISYDYDPPQIGSFPGPPHYVPDSHWKILEWDMGTTEAGSSGCSLFDPDQRIVGNLTGGDANCVNRVNDYFTRFNYAWDYYPEPEKQLKAWLDPDNSGVMVLDGLDPVHNGITEPEPEPELKVYPNPSSGVFTLEVPAHSTRDVSVTVFTMDGKKAWSMEDHGPGIVRIDLSGHAPGLYLLVVKQEGKSTRRLIIKQ
jgi:lysyl endopeptidase